MRAAWLTLACLAALLTGVFCNGGNGPAQWGYDGQGAPLHWAALSPQYAACAEGKQQSPIDVAGYLNSSGAAPISLSYNTDATAIRNDGRFVHVDYAAGNTLSVGERTYELKSAHLHSPSEHLIDGESFAAELHLVHSDADGNLAVIGLVFKQGPPSPLVQEILDAAPDAGDVSVDGFTHNAKGFAPDDTGHYRYDGSKTTPPYDEPVDWYVTQRPQDHCRRAGCRPVGPERRRQQSSCPALGESHDNNHSALGCPHFRVPGLGCAVPTFPHLLKPSASMPLGSRRGAGPLELHTCMRRSRAARTTPAEAIILVQGEEAGGSSLNAAIGLARGRWRGAWPLRCGLRIPGCRRRWRSRSPA